MQLLNFPHHFSLLDKAEDFIHDYKSQSQFKIWIQKPKYSHILSVAAGEQNWTHIGPLSPLEQGLSGYRNWHPHCQHESSSTTLQDLPISLSLFTLPLSPAPTPGARARSEEGQHPDEPGLWLTALSSSPSKTGSRARRVQLLASGKGFPSPLCFYPVHCFSSALLGSGGKSIRAQF